MPLLPAKCPGKHDIVTALQEHNGMTWYWFGKLTRPLPGTEINFYSYARCRTWWEPNGTTHTPAEEVQVP
jgi:hypothetical protein